MAESGPNSCPASGNQTSEHHDFAVSECQCQLGRTHSHAFPHRHSLHLPPNMATGWHTTMQVHILRSLPGQVMPSAIGRHLDVSATKSCRTHGAYVTDRCRSQGPRILGLPLASTLARRIVIHSFPGQSPRTIGAGICPVPRAQKVAWNHVAFCGAAETSMICSLSCLDAEGPFHLLGNLKPKLELCMHDLFSKEFQLKPPTLLDLQGLQRIHIRATRATLVCHSR